MTNVKTGYLRVLTNSGIGFVCVAVEVQPRGVAGEYRAAFSFCNPTDNFNKQKARSLAVSRLSAWRMVKDDKGKPTDEVSANRVTWIGSHNTISSVFLVALDNAIKTGKAPHWLSKATRKGPVSVGLKQTAQQFDVSVFS